jgi:hypothetical protein
LVPAEQEFGAAMTGIAATDLIAELDNVVKAGSPERRLQIVQAPAGAA